MDIISDTNQMDKEYDDEDENPKLSGGFKLFGFGDTFTNAIKRTKTSENKLINTYEVMDKSVKKYHHSYDTHMKNLAKLDDYANFHGMENLFKKVIMKDSFANGKVDKSTPILFRNYLIQEETTPSAFRKEHIMRQIQYVLNKYFAGREHLFIKEMYVDIGKNEFILYITTIENRKVSRKVSHTGYVISISETKTALKDILGTAKKNLKRKSKLVELNNYNSDADNGSITSSKKRTSKKKIKSKNNVKTRSGSKKRTKTRSKGNLSIFNKSNNTNNINNINNANNNNKKNKYKIKTNTGDINNLPSTIKIGNETSNKSSKKSVLNMYLTPSEKAAKTAVKSIPAATQFSQPFGAPGQQLPPAQGLEERKAEILGQPNINFQQTAQPTTDQFGQQQNPDEARCNAIPNPSWDTCKPNNCRFDGRTYKCAAFGPRPPRPQYGPPQYGPPPPQFGGPPPPQFGGPPPPQFGGPPPPQFGEATPTITL